MSDIKVRVGQSNTVRVVSSVSGTAGGKAVVSENVIGGISSVSSLNVSGLSTFVGVATSKDNFYVGNDLHVAGNAQIVGVLTAKVLYSTIYGEILGGSLSGTTIVGTALSISGISTFANGTVLVGGGNSIGNQVLQVVGVNSSVYIGGRLGIGLSNPETQLGINGVLGFTNGNILIGNPEVGIKLSPGNIQSYYGINNISIGNSSASELTYGYDNIFLGNNSGKFTSLGYYNTFINSYSGYSNLFGSYNTFLGNRSGFSNVNGSTNSFYGSYSGYSNLFGSNNLYLGSYTGISTNVSNKIIVGSGYDQSYLFDSPDITKDYQLAVGIRTNNGSSQYWLVGNENFNIGIGITNPTSKLHVDGDAYVTGVITASNFYVGSNLLVGAGGSISELYVSGISTLLTISYPSANTNGVAYFNSNKIVTSTGSTSSGIDYTNYILTTDNSGIPTWSNTIDGGVY